MLLICVSVSLTRIYNITLEKLVQYMQIVPEIDIQKDI
jgi:hypothetical protein